MVRFDTVHCQHDLQIKLFRNRPFSFFLSSWREVAEIGGDTMVSLEIFYLYVRCNRRQFCLYINTLSPPSKEDFDQR